ncbi:hypothetical protein HMN09_00390900 [Mycena chlorophos]|uniref:CxC5 like cysteine cluster associated with KDZ domain-containing protein n=1 Tax=Mycena chlorophos TaxID=658473 RepID=A0A8H6TK67_MYCCL|nr:hypothetical protein HMN09_00390900 [Mycena chlorophos]
MTPILDTANVLFSSPARFQTVLLVVTVLHRFSHYINSMGTASEVIPAHIVNFLSIAVLQQSQEPQTEIYRVWGLMQEDSAASWKGLLLNSVVDDLLRESGPAYDLGAEMLSPPHTHCVEENCPKKGTKLGNPYATECRIFTLHRGVLPARNVSVACRYCKTRYHYAFSVKEPQSPNSKRLYYQETLPYIHAQTGSYVENSLCNFFGNLICSAHASTTNLARSYNSDLGRTQTTMKTRLKHEITHNIVMDAFFMHALLLRARRYGNRLELTHRGENEHRFDAAMDVYNSIMSGTGQPRYAHACLDCFKIFEDPTSGELRFIRGGTTDGVTIGHPRCRIELCRVPLTSMKDKLCSQHAHLKDRCLAPVAHRAKEEEHARAAEPAFMDLDRRLAKDGVSTHTPRRKTTPTSTQHRSSPRKRSTPIKLDITRNWSHNDQLFILCCGIIISRATFIHDEGVSSVAHCILSCMTWPRANGYSTLRLPNKPTYGLAHFKPITREMSTFRFNFFLDEMITLRNEWFVSELDKDGRMPFMLDFEDAKSRWLQNNTH